MQNLCEQTIKFSILKIISFKIDQNYYGSLKNNSTLQIE